MVGWVVDYELYVTRKPLMIIIPFSFLVTGSEAMLAPGGASMECFLFRHGLTSQCYVRSNNNPISEEYSVPIFCKGLRLRPWMIIR